MASDSRLHYFLQLLSLLVLALALPQTPDTTCYPASAYQDTTKSSPCHPSSFTEMIPSTMTPVVQSTPQSGDYCQTTQKTHNGGAQYQQHYPSQTRYPSVNCFHEYSSALSNLHPPYNSKSPQMSTSPHLAGQGTSEFRSRCPTSTYPSTRASISTPSSPLCTPGVDVNKPGLFELWSYAPGVCDLDNKVVTPGVYPCPS